MTINDKVDVASANSSARVQRSFIDVQLYKQPSSTAASHHVSHSLTPQQNKVLLLGEGLLNKQIAYELRVSEATIKAHVSAILQKLRANGRHQAVQNARRDGLLTQHQLVGAC